ACLEGFGKTGLVQCGALAHGGGERVGGHRQSNEKNGSEIHETGIFLARRRYQGTPDAPDHKRWHAHGLAKPVMAAGATTELPRMLTRALPGGSRLLPKRRRQYSMRH